MSQAVPFYLQRTEDLSNDPVVNFNDNFSYIKTTKGETTVWEDIAAGVDSGAGAVLEKVSGTWQGVKDEVSSVSGGIGETITKTLGVIRDNLIFAVIIGLVVIYFVAKSGILHQVAEVMALK